jgi:phage terminase small subunit
MARGPQRLGAFARELASGKRPYEAAIAAGYPDGSCARRNAQKRAARADVKALVAELRAPIAEKLEITLAVLIERADQIYRQAMLAGQFNAAISALKELGILSGKRIERAERGEPGEFDRMSDEELHKAVLERAERLGLVPKDETQH